MQSCRAPKTPGVHEAKIDESDKVGIEVKDHEKTRFRGVAARVNYFAMDRNEKQFVAKELSRKMANPKKLGTCGGAQSWSSRSSRAATRWMASPTALGPGKSHEIGVGGAVKWNGGILK